VALTRASLCIIFNYPASSIRFVVFHKVVRRHYSGQMGEFTTFWCETSSGTCTPKIIKIGSLLDSKYKSGEGGVFFETPCIFAVHYHHRKSTAEQWACTNI